jgi:homoserine O-acetyltransferase/O-succinyltransferase
MIMNALVTSAVLVSLAAYAWSQEFTKPIDDDYVKREFHFRSGEVLPELRLHYQTMGSPRRDRTGHTTNAIVIMHATTGDGTWYTQNKVFAAELFGSGQLLDAVVRNGPTDQIGERRHRLKMLLARGLWSQRPSRAFIA